MSWPKLPCTPDFKGQACAAFHDISFRLMRRTFELITYNSLSSFLMRYCPFFPTRKHTKSIPEKREPLIRYPPETINYYTVESSKGDRPLCTAVFIDSLSLKVWLVVCSGSSFFGPREDIHIHISLLDYELAASRLLWELALMG